MTAIIDLDSDHDTPDEPDQTAEDAERWQPDDQLLTVVLNNPHSPRKLTEMPAEDRCHLVAGLTAHGWSAKEIRHRCGGSIRLVKFLRAEPLTQVCRWAIEEVEKVAREARAEKALRLATQSDLEQSRRREIRLRAQNDQLVAALKAGVRVELCSKGLHLMVDYNTYRNGGKQRCRACRQDWEAANRNPSHRGPKMATRPRLTT